MRRFRIEVFADGRPVRLEKEVLDGSNHGVAARRGYAEAKKKLRRGTKQVTIRVTALGDYSTAIAEEEAAQDRQYMDR